MAFQQSHQVLKFVDSYKSKNYCESLSIIENIHENILSDIRKKNIIRTPFEKPFYFYLVEILQLEVGDFENVNVERLKITQTVFATIRESFYECSTNQNTFCDIPEAVDILKRFVSTFFSTELYYKMSDSTEEEKNKWSLSHSRCASACVTCIANLMAGNSILANRLTPLLMPFVMTLLTYPLDIEVGLKAASILHQFFINDELRQNISLHRKDLRLLPILKLFKQSDCYTDFAQFCIENILFIEGFLSEEWNSFDEAETLIVLNVLSSIESEPCHPRKKDGVPLFVVQFCKAQFKLEADKVLSNKECQSLRPRILTQMASFLCNCAANFHRSIMQADKSCLISTVFLLKALTQAGDSGVELYSRLNDLSVHADEENPVFGFKTDLIKLIASLVYRNRENQDLVRDSDGIGLILTNSQYDGNNPLIREASVLAIRNLLEGNVENQKVVEELQCVGGIQSPLLEQMGAKVTLENGKPKIEKKK